MVDAAVVISYRRQLDGGYAGRLLDGLTREFGEDQIFMDLTIGPGIDFVDAIERAVGGCRFLLAIISPLWAGVEDEQGAPRLFSENDYVNLEVRIGLERPGVRVIPVLVNDAKMPRSEQLPDHLKPLTRLNAHTIADNRWKYDVGMLVEALAGADVAARARSLPAERASDAVEEQPPKGVAERLAAGGIVGPPVVISAARHAGLRLPLACALLEVLSAGGRNVFGNDPTIFAGAGVVTREKYEEYKRQRVASGNRLMQGVGPCRLTWWELQDSADDQGGCWRPGINMRIGFRHFGMLVRLHGEAGGARRYNGAGPAAETWSRELLEKAAVWEARLGAV